MRLTIALLAVTLTLAGCTGPVKYNPVLGAIGNALQVYGETSLRNRPRTCWTSRFGNGWTTTCR